MGAMVAERPMRVNSRPTDSRRRSRLSERWTPRLLEHTSWISSTMTHWTSRNFLRKTGAVRTMERDSGVVMKMWGGLRVCCCRSRVDVSPERTPTRMAGGSSPSSRASASISARGSSRFLLMSFARAFRGET